MKLIFGTVKSTQLQWLPVFTNIAPPDLRKKLKLINSIRKVEYRRKSLLAERLEDILTLRLKSRRLPWKTAKDLMRSEFETKKCWCDEWTNSIIPNIVNPRNNSGSSKVDKGTGRTHANCFAFQCYIVILYYIFIKP